jgi:chaperonin GroES
MKLTPLSNRILIKPLEGDKMTASGIVLPETSGEKPTQGEIIAVGPGKRDEKGELIAMNVKVGDKVLFKKYGPDEIEVDGVKMLVGDEEDVLAIIE